MSQNQERSTMTKADIVEKVYQKIGFSKKEASELVEMVFSQLKDVLCKGDKVKISGCSENPMASQISLAKLSLKSL